MLHGLGMLRSQQKSASTFRIRHDWILSMRRISEKCLIPWDSNSESCHIRSMDSL